MIHPDEEVRQAIKNLQTDPNFAVLYKWLESSRDSTLFGLVNIAGDTPTCWLQGRAQILVEQVKLFSDPNIADPPKEEKPRPGVAGAAIS